MTTGLPVLALHYVVCDSVYRNHLLFIQHCFAVNEKQTWLWSLHLCEDNDFCSPLIISFGWQLGGVWVGV